MIAADIAGDVVIPAAVALIGAFLAGLSAVMKTYFENRDARRATERQLDLAMKRTEFVEKWIAVSRSFGEHDAARQKAIAELNEAYDDAQMAIQRSRAHENTVVRQLRFLLMLRRRVNLWSYVVSGVFLFTTIAAWFVLCIPEPGTDFSPSVSIIGSIFVTLTLRVIAEVVVRGLDGASRSRARRRIAAPPVESPGLGSETEMQASIVAPSTDVASNSTDGQASDTSPAPDVAATIPSVADQLRALVMMPKRRNKLSYVVSAFFIVSLPVMTLAVLGERVWGDSSGDYPRCVGYYSGGIFGEAMPIFWGLYEDQLVTADGAPYDGVGPKYHRWTSTEILPDGVDTQPDDDYVPEYLIGLDGTRYAVNPYDGDLYFYDGTTRLLNQRFSDIGDPCDPIEVKVKTVVRDTALDDTSGESFVGWPDFTYYDGENAQLVDLVRADEGSAIEAYFGVDGRLMPVCSDDRQLLYTCVERGDVYYDSGTSDLIRRLVEAGFLVIGLAIVARLLAGLLVLGLERMPWPLARPDVVPDDQVHGVRPA